MSGSDATVRVAGPLLDIVDDEWRADTLPFDGQSHSCRVLSSGSRASPFSQTDAHPARPLPQRYPCRPASPLPRTTSMITRRTSASRNRRSGTSSPSPPSPTRDGGGRDGILTGTSGAGDDEGG